MKTKSTEEMQNWLRRKYVFGVIHKPCGQIFGHFDPPPPLWTILLNKTYVVIWTFGKPPSPLPCPHGLWMPPYRVMQQRLTKMIYGNVREDILSQNIYFKYFISEIIEKNDPFWILLKKINLKFFFGNFSRFFKIFQKS